MTSGSVSAHIIAKMFYMSGDFSYIFSSKKENIYMDEAKKVFQSEYISRCAFIPFPWNLRLEVTYGLLNPFDS